MNASVAADVCGRFDRVVTRFAKKYTANDAATLPQPADAEQYKEDVLSASRHLHGLTPFPVARRRRVCPSTPGVVLRRLHRVAAGERSEPAASVAGAVRHNYSLGNAHDRLQPTPDARTI